MHQTRGIAEEVIISQCKQGSLKSQEMLYKHFYGYAMGIGLRYCLNREDALEVVNDGFIKIFNTIKIYDDSKPFKAWMLVIMVNTAIDRRRKDLKTLLNTELDNIGVLSTSVSAVDKLDADDILGLMKQLPAVQSAVFNLHEIDGYSHEEIAKLLSIPASSSRVYLVRAKDKLRSMLKEEEQKYGRSGI
jgi:RNA polymerase sigma-70 factor (ECF subfamily)